MKGLFGRLKDGLRKTRHGLRESLDRVLGQARINDEDADALEEALLRADVSLDTTEKLIDALRSGRTRLESDGEDWARAVLHREIVAILGAAEAGGPDEADPAPLEGTAAPDEPTGAEVRSGASGPRVVMIVGVNGTGKTTTVGKLAHHHREAGERVLVVAADTFRAAANEQLALWADRAGVEIVQSRSGADPASVAFDGIAAGVTRGADVILVDTAGRLHSKVGLMEEMNKIHRVMGKALPGAPHEVLLVLDGTTGQNAIQQAREFSRGFPITSLVLTKIDGTARGGVVVSIADVLGLPVRWIGVGEGIEDLIPFDAEAFAQGLLAGDGDASAPRS